MTNVLKVLKGPRALAGERVRHGRSGVTESCSNGMVDRGHCMRGTAVLGGNGLRRRRELVSPRGFGMSRVAAPGDGRTPVKHATLLIRVIGSSSG